MVWHVLGRFTRAAISFGSSCVFLPEKLSAFLKYIQHTAGHLFSCQIHYAACLFTLPFHLAISNVILSRDDPQAGPAGLAGPRRAMPGGWAVPVHPSQSQGHSCTTPQFQLFCFVGCVFSGVWHVH